MTPAALGRSRQERSRRGLTVAVLGPDGAGKTTLARALAADPALRARRFYMGTNPHEQKVRLPGGGPGGRNGAARPFGPLAFMHRLADQWYRYALARWHRLRGGVVVFDRYIYAPRTLEEPRELTRRLRRRLLHLGAPRPDLVVVLDAPPEVLLARKNEHDASRLEGMRRDYARLRRRIPEAVVVDAARDAEEVRRLVVAMIHRRLGGEGSVPARRRA